MDPTIIAAIIGAIAVIVAGVIGKITFNRRRKKTRNFQNAFQAGWGLSRLVNQWLNNSNVDANFKGMIVQVQPFFKALGFNIDLLDSFTKGELPKDLMPFLFQIESELTARFGRDTGNAFKLGQALVSNTQAMYKYVTDSNYRSNMDNQGIKLSGITAALDEPLEKLSLPKSIKKEWKDIISSVASGSFNENNKDELWSRIQQWIARVWQALLGKGG